MVISQFDQGPYAYFSGLLESRFGRERVLADFENLTPLMEELRSRLFIVQVEAHARELHRALDKDRGIADVSVELFRTLHDSDRFFLVNQIPTAFEILGRSYYFHFEDISPEASLRCTHIGSGRSILLCSVLKPIRVRPRVLRATSLRAV
jgi:hypothetical protein